MRRWRKRKIRKGRSRGREEEVAEEELGAAADNFLKLEIQQFFSLFLSLFSLL